MLKLVFCIANMTCTPFFICISIFKLYILCFVVFGLLMKKILYVYCVMATFLFASEKCIALVSFGGKRRRYINLIH